MLYAEILLPVPIAGTFTYRVPAEMENSLGVGHRVIVPFGRRKSYTGIVSALTPLEPIGYEVKEIAMRIDDRPIVRHPQLKFWNWVADYYLCTPGEVYKAAVPAGLKIESETFISPVPGFEEDENYRLSTRELALLEGLLATGEKRVSLDSLARKTGITTVGPVVNSLLARNAVMVSENLVERYHARKETYVRLSAARGDSDALHAAFDAVKKGSKQESALLALIELSGFMRQGLAELNEVTRTALMERSGATSTVIAAMAKKGIVEVYTRKVSRFSYFGVSGGGLPKLTDIQGAALDKVHKSWLEKDITLLHGVTSSGKTELYIHLIDYVMRRGRQALYLVPEIALTTQLTSRLQRVFGDKVLIYHSRFSDNERVEIWNRLLDDPSPCVVIGARSSVFLPFGSLGLVIVDEEHESAYKQQDPAPRYNARDAAVVLASMHGAKTLLGSATPSVETFWKAVNGRYGLVELLERYEGGQLPEMRLVDMTLARKKGEVKGIFSDELREDVSGALGRGMQSILFLNRRGYAPVARCKMCGFVPKCDHCDVSLTYHRRIDKLLCHYCGTPYAVPDVCPACKEPGIEVLGYGTERIEEEVDSCFPGVAIARLDLDTTRNKDSYENIIEDFSRGKSQILVGTQMVTKGLDFENVKLVGVMDADSMINFPDFRAEERAYCMLMQVSGRCGRRGERGKVVIQAADLKNRVYTMLTEGDYPAFFAGLLAERQLFVYPPAGRMIQVEMRHKDVVVLRNAANVLAGRLREKLGKRICGPAVPEISRIGGQNRLILLVKIEPVASCSRIKTLLKSEFVHLRGDKVFGSVRIFCDVDP